MPGRRLDLRERESIERGLAAGLAVGAIAVLLGRAPSTIRREIERNGVCRADAGPAWRPGCGFTRGRPRTYRAARADGHARRRARRPKPYKLTGALALAVAELLRADHSPEQIAHELPRLYPDDDGMRVSSETIYQSLFVQTRGELRRELSEHLRSKRPHRRSRTAVHRRGLVGIVPIAERPPEAADRAVPGHWEGDLILGGVGKGAIVTLVERRSRFLLLAPLPDSRKAIDLQTALVELITKLPDALRRTLTWDRGSEMANHARIAVAADIRIYFADPHAPWQRPTNENTNGLLRQYFPKGADLRQITTADTDRAADLLNNRPRKTLGWKTPTEVFNEALGATTG